MRKNNIKLNFPKNCWASWFSCGQLKISKCTISLTWLDECSKSKITPHSSETWLLKSCEEGQGKWLEMENSKDFVT